MSLAPNEPPPFSVLLGRLIRARAEALGIRSGRALGSVLGKSAGAVSQMLKGTLVPSGDAIMEISRVLELGAEDTEALLRAAVRSKLQGRTRDTFWLELTVAWERRAKGDNQALRAFIESKGLWDEYLASREKLAAGPAESPAAPPRNRLARLLRGGSKPGKKST